MPGFAELADCLFQDACGIGGLSIGAEGNRLADADRKTIGAEPFPFSHSQFADASKIDRQGLRSQFLPENTNSSLERMHADIRRAPAFGEDQHVET